MISPINPNRVLVFAVTCFVAYWLVALFVPGHALRDVMNSFAFGVAITIVVTWLPSAIQAVRRGG